MFSGNFLHFYLLVNYLLLGAWGSINTKLFEIFLVLLRGFSLVPDFSQLFSNIWYYNNFINVVSKETERKKIRFPMAWEVDDGEQMDHFNADYGWKHENDCYDDDSREYIKSTVAVDFLPYIGLLVRYWPSVLVTGTKNTT